MLHVLGMRAYHTQNYTDRTLHFFWEMEMIPTQLELVHNGSQLGFAQNFILVCS